MSNKKLFKEIYSDKINKDKNYQEILKLIEKTQTKKNILKKSLLPITSVLVVSFLIILNLNNGEKTSNLNTPLTDIYNESNVSTTNKNESNSNSYIQDIDIKIIDIDYEELINNDDYLFLKNIEIPNDLNIQTYHANYIKENNDADYTTLHNYSFRYQHPSENRNIIISFSNKYEPLRYYIYSSKKQTKKINNTEIIFYQNENSYIILFTYNNINFDIETNNITEEEITNLLTSIIK